MDGFESGAVVEPEVDQLYEVQQAITSLKQEQRLRLAFSHERRERNRRELQRRFEGLIQARDDLALAQAQLSDAHFVLEVLTLQTELAETRARTAEREEVLRNILATGQQLTECLASLLDDPESTEAFLRLSFEDGFEGCVESELPFNEAGEELGPVGFQLADEASDLRRKIIACRLSRAGKPIPVNTGTTDHRLPVADVAGRSAKGARSQEVEAALHVPADVAPKLEADAEPEQEAATALEAAALEEALSLWVDSLTEIWSARGPRKTHRSLQVFSNTLASWEDAVLLGILEDGSWHVEYGSFNGQRLQKVVPPCSFTGTFRLVDTPELDFDPDRSST